MIFIWLRVICLIFFITLHPVPFLLRSLLSRLSLLPLSDPLYHLRYPVPNLLHFPSYHLFNLLLTTQLIQLSKLVQPALPVYPAYTLPLVHPDIDRQHWCLTQETVPELLQNLPVLTIEGLVVGGVVMRSYLFSISVARLFVWLIGLGLWLGIKRLEWQDFYVYLLLGLNTFVLLLCVYFSLWSLIGSVHQFLVMCRSVLLSNHLVWALQVTVPLSELVLAVLPLCYVLLYFLYFSLALALSHPRPWSTVLTLLLWQLLTGPFLLILYSQVPFRRGVKLFGLKGLVFT